MTRSADDFQITVWHPDKQTIEIRPPVATAPSAEPVEFNTGAGLEFNTGDDVEFNL